MMKRCIAILLATASACGCAHSTPATRPTAADNGFSSTQPAGEAPVIFDAPRLNASSVENSAEELAKNGFAIDALATADGFAAPAEQFSGRARIGWNEQGLLVGFLVHEPSLLEANNPNELWRDDAVEMVISSSQNSSDGWQAIVSPGLDGINTSIRTQLNDRRSAALARTPIHLLIARQKTADGYALQALLPWDSLAITPRAGLTIALQLDIDSHVLESDGGNGPARLAWFPSLNSYRDSKLTHVLRLSDHASPPVHLAGSVGIQRLRRLQVGVVTDHTLSGKTITARLPDGMVNSAQIDPHAESAITSLQLPLTPPPLLSLTTMPIERHPIASVNIELKAGDQSTIVSTSPDLADNLMFTYWRERLSARNFIFTTDDLPPIDFERPSEVEDAIGNYHLKTTYYDAEFNPVQLAARPGRYGAVVEVLVGSHLVDRRYVTLFRTDRKLDWRGAFVGAAAKLPPEAGIDPAVFFQQQDQVSQFLRGVLNNSQSRDQSLAVLFSGLSEIHTGAIGPRYQRFARRDDAWWVELKKRLGFFQPYRTVVHLPPEYQRGTGKHWPLILFLHGSDPLSDTLEMVQSQGLCAYATQHPELPFIVISPATPPNERFSPATLSTLLDEAMKQYDVDPDRVYLTGLSLGGMGTWDLAAETPERFAAAAPIAGYGDPGDAERLKNLPLWAFHGDADASVPIESDRQSIEALRAAGGRVKFTVYPGVGHNSWDRTYANPELYDWFLQQRRGAPVQSPYSSPASMPDRKE